MSGCSATLTVLSVLAEAISTNSSQQPLAIRQTIVEAIVSGWPEPLTASLAWPDPYGRAWCCTVSKWEDKSVGVSMITKS